MDKDSDDDRIPLDGQISAKLIEAKEQWARDGRGLSTPEPASPHRRLPPGQHLTQDWPVLDLGLTPALDRADWSLSVAGAVASPLRWSWDQFMAQPQSDMISDIHCVTTWSRYDNHWQGVAMRRLLDLVQPRPSAAFVMLRSYDGYTTNLPLSHLLDDDVILAHSWEGQPLSRDHGGPVRLIIPKLYLWKSAKWLRAITFMDKDSPGYWELRGYHDLGDPWKEQRYR